jgi:hypothetical protein
MKDKIIKNIEKSIQLGDDIIKYFELFDQHMKPCGDDLLLIVLKGHLIIERFLEMNLCRLLDVDELPQGKGRLGFKQKLQLFEEVLKKREAGPKSPNSSLCVVINELNDVRNRMAHNLVCEADVEKKVRDLVNCYHSRVSKKIDSKQVLAEKLRQCIRGLCSFLSKARVHFHKLELADD